eukprot:171246_1
MKKQYALWFVQIRQIHEEVYQYGMCNLRKPRRDFDRHITCKLGFDISRCKCCRKESSYQWRCTEDGYFATLVYSAKWNQVTRYNRKGLDPPEFQLSKQYLQEMYYKQIGKGFYSHIPLRLMPLSDWQASLERLNPDNDYVQGNVVFEAYEFNTACQWSLGKILQIPSLIRASTNIKLDDSNTAKNPLRKAYRTRRKPHVHDNTCYCHDCNQWKLIGEFHPRRRTICKLCRSRETMIYQNTFRGDTRNEFKLTFNDGFDMLEKQVFRCAYSGIPMTFQTNTDLIQDEELLRVLLYKSVRHN